jgi:hypothetical protein
MGPDRPYGRLVEGQHLDSVDSKGASRLVGRLIDLLIMTHIVRNGLPWVDERPSLVGAYLAPVFSHRFRAPWSGLRPCLD